MRKTSQRRCTEDELASEVNRMLSAIVRINDPLDPDTDLAINIQGDIVIRNHSRGDQQVKWRDVQMQKEIRQWVPFSTSIMGTYKPDSIVQLNNLADTAISISLVGESKCYGVDPEGHPIRGSEPGWSSKDTMTETKAMAVKWKAGLSKLMIYLITANQCFGTWIGILTIGTKFARLLHLGDVNGAPTIAIECNPALHGQLGEDAAQLGSKFIDNPANQDHLPHDLAGPSGVEVNDDALGQLYTTYAASINLLLSLPVIDPFPRLPTLETNVSETWRVVKHRSVSCNVSDGGERAEIVKSIYPKAKYRGPPKADKPKPDTDGGPGGGGEKKRGSSDGNKDGGRRKKTKIAPREKSQRLAAQQQNGSVRADATSGASRDCWASQSERRYSFYVH